jgi:hypothetical protein
MLATDSMLPREPKDNRLASEPAEPMHRIEPEEPIDKIEPAEPIDKIEPTEPMDKIDPREPRLKIDPDERDEPPLTVMGPFCRNGQGTLRPWGETALSARHSSPRTNLCGLRVAPRWR